MELQPWHLRAACKRPRLVQQQLHYRQPLRPQAVLLRYLSCGARHGVAARSLLGKGENKLDGHSLHMAPAVCRTQAKRLIQSMRPEHQVHLLLHAAAAAAAGAAEAAAAAAARNPEGKPSA